MERVTEGPQIYMYVIKGLLNDKINHITPPFFLSGYREGNMFLEIPLHCIFFQD